MFNNESGGIWDVSGNNIFGSGSTVNNAGVINALPNFNGFATTINAALNNTGSVEVHAGQLDITGAVTGTGSFKIDDGTDLEFGSSVAAGATVTFSGVGTLQLAQSLSYDGAISGFATGVVLDLADLAYSSSEYTVWTQVTTGVNAAGSLRIYASSGTLEETLNLNGTYSQSDFSLAPDANPLPGTEVVQLQVNQWINASGGSWVGECGLEYQ